MKMTPYEWKISAVAVVAAVLIGVGLQQLKPPMPECKAAGPVVQLFMPCAGPR